MDTICQKILDKCAATGTVYDISTTEGYRGPHDGAFGVIGSHLGNTKILIPASHELFTTYRETCGNKLIFFGNAEERDNCFEYLTSGIMKYYASKIRKNQRVPWQFVPVPDFSRKCDDSSLTQFFGFTDDEYNAILAENA